MILRPRKDDILEFIEDRLEKSSIEKRAFMLNRRKKRSQKVTDNNNLEFTSTPE